jgi:hypothetical protein
MPCANPKRRGGLKKAGNPEVPAQVGWIYPENLTGILPLPGGLILGRFTHGRTTADTMCHFAPKPFRSRVCPIDSYWN